MHLPCFLCQVDGKRYKVRNILVAVGGRPSKLQIPGAEFCITSDEALELPEAPKYENCLEKLHPHTYLYRAPRLNTCTSNLYCELGSYPGPATGIFCPSFTPPPSPPACLQEGDRSRLPWI